MRDDVNPIAVLFGILLCILLLPIALVMGAGVLIYKYWEKCEKEAAKRRAEEEKQERIEFAAAVAEATSQVCNPKDHSFYLAADAREMFTTQELLAGRVYAVTIVGKYFYNPANSHSETWVPVDSFHCVDRFGNFTEPYDGMRIDGKPVPKDQYHQYREDRAAHHYQLHLDGTGAKVSFALRCPNARPFRGGVFVKLEALPEKARSPAAEERETTRRAANEAHQGELQRKVASWLLLAKTLSNWGDDEFRVAAAKRYTDAFLDERGQIASGYIAFHSKDAEVARFLRENHPKEYAALTGRLATYLIAEREDVTPRPRRRRPTTAEVQGRIGRREATAAQDELVAMDAAMTGYNKKVASLRAKGIADQDDIENLIGTPADAVSAARLRLEAGKGGSNVALTKLG